MSDLTGQHVVITGGSRGIGAALGRAFVRQQAKVTLVARDPHRLERVAAEIGASFVAADLSGFDSLGDLAGGLERSGPIDILIHNAGLDATGAFAGLRAARLHALWMVNAVAPAELSRMILPAMLARGTGRIVFVSSLSANVSTPGLVAYSATKAALPRLAEGLRNELGGTGVAVTLAEIGTVRTDMYDAIREYPPAARALDRTLASHTVRLLTKDEVANAIVTACRRDRGHVVLPRRARAQTTLVRLPQRIANLLTR
jgi:short-subunit dehydrogenase